MRTWNATTITWDRRGACDFTGRNQFCDVDLQRLQICSQPDPEQTGELRLGFRTSTGLDYVGYRNAMECLKKLQFLKISEDESSREKHYYSDLIKFSFTLHKRQCFTDRAIVVAGEIASQLGIAGKNLDRYLSAFHVTQETRVRIDGGWIGFADYLRRRHNLPPFIGGRIIE